MEVFHIKVVKAPNRYAVVKLVDGERNFLPGGNLETNQILNLDSEDFNYIKQFHLVHSSAFSFTEKYLPKIKNTNVKISFDYSNYFESDYLDKTLPYIDYAFFSTEQKSSKEIKLFQKETSLKGPKLVLVTRGAKGAILFYKGAYMMQPAIDTTAIDTLGAGDAFIASFLVSFMKFESLKNGLEMAAIRASQVCMYYGAFGYGLDYK